MDGITWSIGRCNVIIQIGHQKHICPVHVIANFKYPFLLGLDIGSIFDLHVDIKDRKVTMKSYNRPKRYFAAHLDTFQNTVLDKLLQNYKNVFSQHNADIGRISIARHHIITQEHPPIQMRPYRRTPEQYDEIRKQVQEMKSKKLIRDSNSPWAFPVTLQPKKDGTMRFCIDYRPLNKITISDKMPLPHIHDVIDRLYSAKYFSTLDIAWGYWHCEMAPDSIEKTAFVTNEGHYEWLVMPFGLKNAPATFQRIIQQILGDLLYKGVINYLDDFIIYSETFEDHIKLLKQIFEKFLEYGIKLKLSKCYFIKEEVEYLGHVISHNSVRPAPSKINAVSMFPTPQNIKELLRFLGMSGYYRRFIKNFSNIAAPLYELLRKQTKWHWNDEQQKAYERLKKLLTSEPILAIFDPKKSCILYTDACAIGVGAILAQKDNHGKEHVIAYFSKRLPENHYRATELECLGVVESVRHFKHYLGKRFTLYTDHRALQWLQKFKDTNRKLWNWSQELSTISYETFARPGTMMRHVDALSRAPVSAHLSQLELETAQRNDNLSYVKHPHQRNNIIMVKRGNQFKAVVPTSLRSKLLKDLHDDISHPGINKTIKLITKHYWWPDCTENIKSYVRSCGNCQLTKTSKQPSIGQYIKPGVATLPKEKMSIDTIVLGPSVNQSFNNCTYKYIQVFIDHHSRYLWAYPTKKNTADVIIQKLEMIFSTVGKTDVILTDNAKQFLSNEYVRRLRPWGTKKVLCTPYHPQTNGIIERANGTIWKMLRSNIFGSPRKALSTNLRKIIQDYNNTPHDITGFTPHFLFFAHDKTPPFSSNQISIDEARELANERTLKFQQKKKDIHDSKHPKSNFKVGDIVIRKLANNDPSLTKMSKRYNGPYTIVKEIGPVTFDIEHQDTKVVSRAHASQLRIFISRDSIEESNS